MSWRRWTDRVKHSHKALQLADTLGRGKGQALLLVDMVTSLGGIEVAVDDWSVDILIRELKELYRSRLAGEPAALDAQQRDLAARKRLRASVAHERFFEIGSPEGLAELDRHLRKPPP